MSYTPLTAMDWGNIARLNAIFAALDAAISGGSVTGTAGEALSERDFVYLASDGEWYQLDTNATAAVAASKLIGCVTNSGGISASGTGTIKLKGIVSGFSGLTAWSPVYGSTTAGSYTQTRPNVTAGGGQLLVAELGYAISATEILLDVQKLVYVKRESLADDGTLTIEHHADPPTRQRKVQAYVASTVAGSSLASYADSNQDDAINLRGPDGSGDSITITASGTQNPIGDASGTEYQTAQQFTTVNGGTLTQFTFNLTTNLGSPTDDIRYEIHGDNSNAPDGSALVSGLHSPTASATNTVSGLSVSLSPATKYWLVLSLDDPQPTGTAYRWAGQGSSVYAGGFGAFSTNGGSSWSAQSVDYAATFTIEAPSGNDKLAQGFQVTGTQTIGSVTLWLKKTGSPTGTLTLRIETDNSGDPSGTLADNDLTTTVSESSLGTSYADVTFTFSTPASISGSTQYHLVLSTDRSGSVNNYVTWGIDTSSPGYTDGELKSENSSSWSAETADGVFEVFGEGTQYDEPLSISSDTGAAAEMGVRFDDGAGSDDDTMTTFQNLTGATADIVCEVVL